MHSLLSSLLPAQAGEALGFSVLNLKGRWKCPLRPKQIHLWSLGATRSPAGAFVESLSHFQGVSRDFHCLSDCLHKEDTAFR